MITKMNKIVTGALVCLMILSQAMLVSCSDSDGNGGAQPEITGVKILSSDTLRYSYDEYYTKAGPGSLLAVMGKNLGGALKVYVNGQELTFNSTMNTDHSLIVSVPTEDKGFKLSAFHDVPDEIRVVTHGGEATFGFKITAPGPQLQRVQALYPRKQGDEINLFGKNLVDIERAYLTNLTAAELDSTEWETVGGSHVEITTLETVVKDHHLNPTSNSYETTSQLRFTMPDVSFDEGCIVLECTSGTVYIPYYRVPGKPVITGISTDMPVPGQDLVITGREFVQVESVTYGDVTLTSDDFIVAETEDQITVPFSRKPTDGSGTTLTVTTPGGKVSVEHFYDYSTIILNFEDGFATDNGWGPNGTPMAQATPDAIPYTSDGNFWRLNATDGGNNWWGVMCYFRKDWNGNHLTIPGYDVIPANAPTSDIYLAMEVWNNNTIFGGEQNPFIHYQIQTVSGKTIEYVNWQNGAYLEKPLRTIDNRQPKQQWYRAVTSMSNFSEWFGKTYADIVADGFDQIRLMHQNRSSAPSTIDVMFDNVRLIYIPQEN